MSYCPKSSGVWDISSIITDEKVSVWNIDDSPGYVTSEYSSFVESTIPIVIFFDGKTH